MNGESLNRQNQQMTLKLVPIFGRSKVTSSIVITMNLGFNSTYRRKKHFPIPLKYIDVTSSTHTDQFLLQKKRIDDCWTVDSSRHLSNSCNGFTKFTLLKEKPPKGYMWFGKRWTKIQTTTRPDHVWPEVWTNIGNAAKNREKPEGAKEKPKLNNARRMRGIYFNDPDGEENKEILRKARSKLERPTAPAMPCKRMDKQHPSITKVMQNNGKEKEFKTMYGCMVESHEST